MNPMTEATFQAVKIDVPQHPVFMRPDSSDLNNYLQVFMQREYACTEALENVQFIIDAGAYVGYSALWFANKFPAARIIALEPDAENFKMLELNTEEEISRIHRINAAVWIDDCKVERFKEKYRDGFQWTAQFKRSPDGIIHAYSIKDVFDAYNDPPFKRKINLLKMDIEGAEVIVLKESASWIDLVDNIVIELHDDTVFGNATQTFLNACADKFTIQRFGEITFAQRRHL